MLPDNVLSLPLVGKNKGHPAVFPVELPAFFIRLLSPKDGLVIDPFGGSGTTAVAAFQAGRSCVLIDNNRKYCLKAEQRLRTECDLNVPIAGHTSKQVSTRRLANLADESASGTCRGWLRSRTFQQIAILFGETESGILFGAGMRPHQRAGRAGQGRPQAAPQGSP